MVNKSNMIKKYNGWYWNLHRWFKWEARYFPNYVIRGIKNLWKWLPLVWKDRDWDDYFILEALKFKLKNTADYFQEKQRFIGWEDEVRYIRICESLIQKIQDEHYKMEYFEFFDSGIDFIRNEDGLYEMKSNVTRDNLESYLLKYPRTRNSVISNPKYENYWENSKGISIAMGIERHLKARRLLFKILEQRIEHWWD